MTDKLHPIIKAAGQEFADGKLDRREFLRIATLLGVSGASAYAMAGLPLPAIAQAARRRVASSSRYARSGPDEPAYLLLDRRR